MPLDQAILDEVRKGSQELWRRFRRGLGPSLVFVTLGLLGLSSGALWLLGPTAEARPSFSAAQRVEYGLLVPVALLAGGALAFLRALKAVVVDGPVLPRLGSLLLAAPLGPGFPPAAEQFAAFGSPGLLARTTRIRDLPLLMFLMRAVLGFDLTPFLAKAQTGAAREALVQDLVLAARAAAGRKLRRCYGALWFSVGLTLALAVLAAWLLR